MHGSLMGVYFFVYHVNAITLYVDSVSDGPKSMSRFVSPDLQCTPFTPTQSLPS